MFNTSKIFFCRHNLKEVGATLALFQKADWSKVAESAAGLQSNVELLRGSLDLPDVTDPPDCINITKWVLGFLDIELVKKFVANPAAPGVRAELVYHLAILTAAAGLAADTQFLDHTRLYTSLTAGADIPAERYAIAHSLSQLANYDRRFEYKVMVFTLLSNPEKIIALTEWEQILFRALLLRVAWQWLRYLDDDEQKLLCQNYFYESVIAGLPVREQIAQYLYSAPGAMDYVLRTKALVDKLSQNSEPLVITTDKNWRSLTLGQLFQKLQAVKERPITNKQITQVVGQMLHGNEDAEELIPLVEKNARLLVKIYQADLVDHTYLEEETDTLKAYKETVQLVLRYLAGPIVWLNIAGYYQKPQPLIPFKTFLFQLYSHEDLTDEKTIQRLLDFTAFLQDNKLLKKTDDLIMFHEADNQFHWNERLFE